jgi:lipoate-protein ligase A
MGLKFDKIRFLETRNKSGPWNMALDEVLLMNYKDDSIPILRFYDWRPACVSIGYFQSMEEEVDIETCKHMGIDLVRRLTGGGAVLHEFELTYSFITKKYPQNILESYDLICNPVVKCLSKLGLDAKFVPLNDIIIDNKKVSGNAQTRKNNTLLQHGTILLDVDFDKMFSVLKIPSQKIKDKVINDAKSRVKGLYRSFEEVAYNLKESFCEKFGAEMLVDSLTKKEEEDSNMLAIRKYSSDQWNLRR